jgi:hypothetical protein
MLVDIIESKAFRLVLIVFLVFIALRYLAKILPNLLKDTKTTLSQNQAGTTGNQVTLTNGTGQTADLNGLAEAYWSAMEGWGTDEQALYNLADKTKIPLFRQVADRYKSLKQEDLLTRIQDELSTTEFIEFQTRAGLL